MESTPWWSQRWVWWGTLGITLVIAMTATAVTIGTSNVGLLYALAAGAWVPFGMILWHKRPTQPMGPLIAFTGVASYLSTPAFLMGGVVQQFEATIEPRPWIMVIGTAGGGAFTFLLLVAILNFPDGRSGTPGLKWFNRILVASLVLAITLGFLSEPPGEATHPFLDTASAEMFRRWFEIVIPLYALGMVAVFLITVLKFRRGEPVRRAQLKWLLFVLAIYLIFTVVTVGFTGMEGFTLTGLILDALFVALIGAAMTLAVLRYRLYEIDRLVSRTVTYALLAVVLAAIYAFPVILIPSMIGQTSDVVIAGATLLAAAAFTPLRNRIQIRVDRRFNRASYDAVREIDALARRLNEAPDADAPFDETIDLVTRTLQPTTIAFWARN